MLRFGFKIEGDPVKALADQLAVTGNAVAAAVAEAGLGLQNELRNQWRATGYSPRLANTWRLKFFRNQGLNAAALIYSRAPNIMRAFAYGATILAKSGRFLAIPTGFNRQGGRRGAPVLISAEEMAKQPRGMTFVQRSKGGALLWWMRVAVSSRLRRTTKAGRPQFHRTGIKDARIVGRVIRDRKRREMAVRFGAVPMFVLMRQVRLPKVLDLKGATVRAQARIAGLIGQYWR